MKFGYHDINIKHMTWTPGQNKELYGVRNLEMTIRFSLNSRPSELFHRSEMSQIKAEISLSYQREVDFS